MGRSVSYVQVNASIVQWLNGDLLHRHSPRVDYNWIQVVDSVEGCGRDDNSQGGRKREMLPVLLVLLYVYLSPFSFCLSSFPLVARAGDNKTPSPQPTTGHQAPDRNDCIAALLKDCNERVLVFANSTSKAETLCQSMESLDKGSARVVRYYSGVSMIDKDKALDMFRDQNCTEPIIMICTDAASRGLDLPRVDHVIMAECATSAVDFLHRVGRSVGRSRTKLLLSFSFQVFFSARTRKKNQYDDLLLSLRAIKQGGQRELDRPEKSAFYLERTTSCW